MVDVVHEKRIAVVPTLNVPDRIHVILEKWALEPFSCIAFRCESKSYCVYGVAHIVNPVRISCANEFQFHSSCLSRCEGFVVGEDWCDDETETDFAKMLRH
jgi:hypothetical protein